MEEAQSPRKVDRQRRARIIAATLEVIAQDGVESVTQRRVASTAGVPSSAPSYYFATTGELLEAAMQEAAERDVAALRERVTPDTRPEDLPALIAAHIADGMGRTPVGTSTVIRLYAAALRSADFQHVAEAWDAAWLDVLTPIVGERGALVAMFTATGLARRGLRSDDQPELDEMLAILRLALATTDTEPSASAQPAPTGP